MLFYHNQRSVDDCECWIFRKMSLLLWLFVLNKDTIIGELCQILIGKRKYFFVLHILDGTILSLYRAISIYQIGIVAIVYICLLSELATSVLCHQSRQCKSFTAKKKCYSPNQIKWKWSVFVRAKSDKRFYRNHFHLNRSIHLYALIMIIFNLKKMWRKSNYFYSNL